MSLLSKLFGRSAKKKAQVKAGKVTEEKPVSEPKRTETTLRKHEGPELTALEIAEQKGWEVKSLPVWEPGNVILDTYEVEDVISGGMGHVYIANHNKWNVKLAIKSPNEMMLSEKDYFARILREANSWTELGLHPNIAYCYYVRNIEDVPHIVVEYVDGGDLKEWIEDGKCIDYRVNIDLAIQFCHGMEFAHSKGMIHRDIKPANVLMTKDGVLKITDFGLVRERGSGVGGQVSAVRSQEEGRKPVDHGLTTVGAFMGTEGYIAPEQAESARDVDERADIFSFGVCLYEMFCGNKPYGITYGKKQDTPDPVGLSGDEKFPSDIGTVLTKSVQWDPSGRYKSFKEIRHELVRIYHELFDEESPYAELEFLDLEADGLNNRGVSYFDLDRKEDAVSCWEQALEINQIHLEATYNLSLIQWRDAKTDDTEVLRRLDNCGNNPLADKERLAELKACINAERSDLEAAKDTLKEYPGRYDILFSDKDIDEIKSVLILEGHTKPVYSVSLTSDGRYAVSGSQDRILRMWDLETGQCLRTMKGHTGVVYSVSLTPDGRYAVSGSDDRTMKLWELKTGKRKLLELKTGKCIRTFRGHGGFIKSVTITSDDKFAVSGSLDNTLKVWDLETGQCLRTLKGHTSIVQSVSLTPDGRYAVSGSSDKTLRMWDLETGQCLRTMKGHTGWVNSVIITSDGRFAVSGSDDTTLRVWDLETGQCLRTLEGHTKAVYSVSLTPDGRMLSGSRDKTLRMWDLKTGQCLRTLEGHTDPVTTVSITPDGRYAVSGSWDKTLRMWDLKTGKSYQSKLMISLPKRFEQRKKEEEILNEAISEAEALYKKGDHKQSFAILYKAWKDIGFNHKDAINRLYSGLMKKGRIKDLSFSFQKKMLRGHTNYINSVSLTPDGRYAVSGGKDKTMKLWDLKTGQCLRSMKGHTKDVLSVSLTPDGRYAVSGGKDKTMKLWDLETGQCLRTMEGSRYYVDSVSLTPDGRYAVSGSEPLTLRLWNLDTGQCLRTMEGHVNGVCSVYSVSLTSDGRYAVSGSQDRILRMWDLETGQCLRTMKGHTGVVYSVSLTPDGRYAVSGGKDKTMKLWDLKTGQCLRTMEGHTEHVYSVSLTPDGRYAVSGSYDKTLRMWDLETGRCVCTMEGHINGVCSVSLTPDGRYAVSGGYDKTLRVWEFIWDLEFD